MSGVTEGESERQDRMWDANLKPRTESPAAVQAGGVREAISWLESIEQTGRSHDGTHPAFVAWCKARYPTNYQSWIAAKVVEMLRKQQDAQPIAIAALVEAARAALKICDDATYNLLAPALTPFLESAQPKPERGEAPFAEGEP